MINEKRMKLMLVVLMIFFVNLSFVSAISGSMGNARMILYPEVNGWTNTIIEKTIFTKNVNDVPIKVELKLGSEDSTFLEIVDSEFILQPGESKKANFLIKVKKEGRYEGKINVFFSPTEGNSAGVVLSSTIIVIAKKDQGYDEIEEEEDLNFSVTGNAIGIGEESSIKQINLLPLILTISTTLLIILLAGLIYWSEIKDKKQVEKNKKKGKNKNEK